MRALVFFLVIGCGGGKGGGVFGPDGGGIQCGGLAGTPCPSDEWCDFDRNDCGADDGTGICKPRPSACDDILDPVCGCDGVMHPNACVAQALGVDVSAMGNCPPDA